MDILRFYHQDGSYDAYCTNSWYHKPCILCELADYANKSPEYFSNKETIFVTSSRYGEKQLVERSWFTLSQIRSDECRDYFDECVVNGKGWF